MKRGKWKPKKGDICWILTGGGWIIPEIWGRQTLPPSKIFGVYETEEKAGAEIRKVLGIKNPTTAGGRKP